ncbi:hypothetical protein FHW23_001169 [Curtobacterium pusillum]|uniref:Uncharacterized protein n=1 Tax=Curtobacterium pusillum TaxID=69373 RepID=A0AAW3T4J2_9MICO|nr:hypothetical protein [Curtobacterium pusillum]MBA8989923.1 hypothetical protein [Curtobacterium pusillum]
MSRPEGIGRGLLIVLAVAAPIATVFALGLQVITLIAMSWRTFNHGSGEYIGSQIAALVIRLGVPLVTLAVGIVAVRRRRDGRSAVVLTVIAALCVGAAGLCIVVPAVGVFQQAPKDDRAYRAQSAQDELDERDPEDPTNAHEAADRMEPEIDEALGVLHIARSDVKVRRDFAVGETDSGNACTTYTATIALPGSLDRDATIEALSDHFDDRDESSGGADHAYTYQGDGDPSLRPADTASEIEYRAGSNELVVESDCIIPQSSGD